MFIHLFILSSLLALSSLPDATLGASSDEVIRSDYSENLQPLSVFQLNQAGGP